MIISASIALIVTTVPNCNMIHNMSIYLDPQLVPINMVFYHHIIVLDIICEVFGGSWHTTQLIVFGIVNVPCMFNTILCTF